jgi:pimeloyl-ACP methyl ester carboxylesterase
LTTRLTVGELAFDARAAGPETGELVILLHGFPQTSYQWRYSLERLAGAGYRAVAPDQRGYSPGARPLAVEAYAMRNLVLDVLGMADALGAQRFHVVGHDWGGIVAWVLAAAVKDRVLSVTALSTAHPDIIAQQRAISDSCQSRATAYFAERKREDAAAKLLADDARLLRADYADLPRAAVHEYLRVLGSEPALRWYRANIDPPEVPAPLGPVEVPALYVFSDEDPTNCRDTADANENVVAGPYRFEVLSGVDHWIAERAPEAFNDLLLEHLAAHGAKR